VIKQEKKASEAQHDLQSLTTAMHSLGRILHIREIASMPAFALKRKQLDVETLNEKLELELGTELRKSLSRFGQVAQVTIRHRVVRDSDDACRNTSWALVTMASKEAADSVLEAESQLAPLSVTLFDQKQAYKSDGHLGQILKKRLNNPLQSSRAKHQWSKLQRQHEAKRFKKQAFWAKPAVHDTTMTLAMAPNMTDNVKQLYKRGLSDLVSDLLLHHGVIDAGYELLIKNADLSQNGNVVSAGSMDLYPRHRKKERSHHGFIDTMGVLDTRRTREERDGIDWSDYLGKHQYHNTQDSTNQIHVQYRPDIKPQILGIRGAARAGEDGLLHVLVEDFVAISAFESRAVKLLIHHKWAAFGQNTFLREIVLFAFRICAWQMLAFLIAQYGAGAFPEMTPGQAVSGSVTAAVSLILSAYFDAFLPLSPRSAHYLYAGGRISLVSWVAIQGWNVDCERRARGSLLQYAIGYVFMLPGVAALLVWFIIVLPVYYTLTLTVHLGPLIAASFLLGATPEGLNALISTGSIWATELQYLGRDRVLQEMQTLGAVSIAVLLALSGRAFTQELSQLKKAGLRDHFGKDVWDVVDVVNLCLTTAVVIFVLSGKDPSMIAQLAVVNTISLWFRGVQMLSGFGTTAKYVSMFFEVTRDMSSFLVMIMIFIVGNGFALTLLFPINLGQSSPEASEWTPLHPSSVRLNVDTLPRAMYTSFNMMMGGFDAELLNDAFSPALAWLVFFLYILIVNIVMLNLLIALMGGSYERVHEKAELETLKNRAKLILEYEKNM
jgi:hypothetical protein